MYKRQALAAFPGGPRDQATSVFIDGDLYVFGGIGKNSKGLTQVFNDVQDVYKRQPLHHRHFPPMIELNRCYFHHYLSRQVALVFAPVSYTHLPPVRA